MSAHDKSEKVRGGRKDRNSRQKRKLLREQARQQEQNNQEMDGEHLGFYLDVIDPSDECESQIIQLKGKSHFLFGREDACDILLENHPTISRKHASIMLGKNNGEIFLCDFSTHGTRVNVDKIDREQPLRLFVGDVIEFGHTSKYYILCGPKEFRSKQYDAMAKALLDGEELEIESIEMNQLSDQITKILNEM